jgi:hypothetical protein
MSIKSAHFLIGRANFAPAFVGRGRDEFHRGLRTISTFLCELDGGDSPLSIVASDRNSQAVPFVKQNRLHGPGLSVRENYGLADKLGLGLLKLAEDRGRTGPSHLA